MRPCAAFLIVSVHALGIKTNFKRVGGRRISFGGTFELRERFPGARAGRAADYLGDPRRVLSAAWPARLIDGPVARDDGVLDYELRQETINFAGLLKVDAVVDVEVRKNDRGAVTLFSDTIRSTARLPDGRSIDVPIDFTLSGRLDPQPPKDASPAAITGAFEFSVSADLIGALVLLPDRALKAAAEAVNRQLDLGGRFTRGIVAGYPTWARANPVASRAASEASPS